MPARIPMALVALVISALALVVAVLGFLKGGRSGEVYIREKLIALRQWRRGRRIRSLSDALRHVQATKREAQELYDRRKYGE